MNLIKNELDKDLSDEWMNVKSDLLLLHQIVRLLRIQTKTAPQGYPKEVKK